MAVFVINEWLWEDSSGTNGVEFQREALRFITKLGASEHQILVIEGSRFDQKAWSLCKGTSLTVRTIVRAFLLSVRHITERCRLIKPEAVVVLPEELASTTNPDDHYLLQAQLAVPGAILVTTDCPLRDAACRAGLICLSREEFLRTYF